MSFIKKDKKNVVNDIKKYSDWDGDWQSYLEYLEKKQVLSHNFERDINGKLTLRPGYYPTATLKDFI